MTLYNDPQLDELLDESPASNESMNSTLIEAVKRIEEANLWKTLMMSDVFQVGSARPEILNSVNAQIKEFAKMKLEECVGIKQPSSQEPVQNVFSEEEISALKLLAFKLIQKEGGVSKNYTPNLNPVQSVGGINAPKMNIQTPPQEPSRTVLTQQSEPDKSAVKRKKAAAKPPGYIPQPQGYIPKETNEAKMNIVGTQNIDGLQNLIQNAILKK